MSPGAGVGHMASFGRSGACVEPEGDASGSKPVSKAGGCPKAFTGPNAPGGSYAGPSGRGSPAWGSAGRGAAPGGTAAPPGRLSAVSGTRTGPEGVSMMREGSGPEGMSSGGSSPAGVESCGVGTDVGVPARPGSPAPWLCSTRSSISATCAAGRRSAGFLRSRPSMTGSSAPARRGRLGSCVSTAPSTATASGPS